MHSAAFLSAILLAAVRADLQLEQEDISQNCTSICRPILELSRTCDVDDDAVPDDLTEDRLQLQCICTNNSFDVQRFTGLCQSCMQQNPVVDNDTDDDDGPDRPDDNNRDINEIQSRCGFQSTSYNASSDANAANGVVVAATRPNNANQLTTTITGGAVGPAPTGAAPTSTGTFTFTSTSTSGSSTIVTTGTSTATRGTTAAAPTGTGAAVAGAPGLEPLGGGMKVFLAVVGAGVLGFWMY